MPSSRGSSRPRELNLSLTTSALAGRFFTTSAPGKPEMSQIEKDKYCMVSGICGVCFFF